MCVLCNVYNVYCINNSYFCYEIFKSWYRRMDSSHLLTTSINSSLKFKKVSTDQHLHVVLTQ